MGISLAKTTDAPQFTSLGGPGNRAELGWVCGWPVKAFDEIKSGPEAGLLASIVHRPGYERPYRVIVSAATYVRRPFSYELDARPVDSLTTWDQAMDLIRELSR